MAETENKKLEEVKSKLMYLKILGVTMKSVVADKFRELYSDSSYVTKHNDEKYEIRITGYRTVSENEKFDELLTQFKKYVSEKEKLICLTYMDIECDPNIEAYYYFIDVMKLSDSKKPFMKMVVPVLKVPVHLVSDNELEELGIDRHFTDGNYIIVYNHPKILWINQHVF